MQETLYFTERQAQAILDLRLAKLIGLEIMALQKEYEELVNKIADYEEIIKQQTCHDKCHQKRFKSH